MDYHLYYITSARVSITRSCVRVKKKEGHAEGPRAPVSRLVESGYNASLFQEVWRHPPPPPNIIARDHLTGRDRTIIARFIFVSTKLKEKAAPPRGWARPCTCGYVTRVPF